MQAARSLEARCCIVGGGPAGVVSGYLLARAGVDVVVLEKHADFFRDFRGDTIHPSTLTLMDELGLLDAFLQRPHSEATELGIRFGSVAVPIADFCHVPGRCKFLAFMPQWDFLDFFVQQARAFPGFRIAMGAEATELIRDDGRVTGVVARTSEGALTVRADLVIVAEGRHSTLRGRAALTVKNIGAPIDVLWMRLSRKADDPGQAFGNVGADGLLVAIDRGDYYQCAFVIRKGEFAAIEARGLTAFRERVGTLAPFLRDRTGELAQWDDVKLLTVTVDRLTTWYRGGLLCIGDAAHAMSPVGGVGINLAIQDAVATANALAAPLLADALETQHLRAVQRRRELPTRLTQMLQVFVQDRILARVLTGRRRTGPPALVRLFGAIPALRRLPALVVGIGFRPEHVRTGATPLR